MAEDFVRFPHNTRTNDPNAIADIQRQTEEGDWDLLPSEIWWRDHQRFLESRGYRLRPRYRPEWIPSWVGTNIKPEFCEDSLVSMHRKTLDAKRLSDNKTILLKRVSGASTEATIAQSLTTPELSQDTRNHCVPIFDYFRDETDGDTAFIVMPLLRRFNSPPFSFVNEVTDFMNQTLEGLVFIHEQGVAHRDISDLNILMDGSSLYPEGFHPASQAAVLSGRLLAKPLRRVDVPSVRYYITDFGISTRFEDPSAPRLVTGLDAQDKDVPELSKDVPYDPFAVDIWTLGSVYKRHFLDIYSNLTFIAPLVDAMMQRDPKDRPTASQALWQFEEIVSRQHGSSLRWHLKQSNESIVRRMSQGVRSVARETLFVVKKLAASPFMFATVMIAVTGSVWSALNGRQSVFSRIRNTFYRMVSSPSLP